MSRRRVVVVGVGNPLGRDEGVGPRAVERLAGEAWAEQLELIDAGTDLLAVLPEVEGAFRVVLVDAVRAGRPPGSVDVVGIEELLARACQDVGARSAHAASVPEAISLARAADMDLPPIVVVAVEPGEVGLGEGLSDACRTSLAEVVATVRRLVEEANPPA